jgi:hypothetical protein
MSAEDAVRYSRSATRTASSSPALRFSAISMGTAMNHLPKSIIVGLLAYAGMAAVLWILVPLLLQDAGSDWNTWAPVMLWLPSLLVAGYAAGRFGKRHGFLAGLIVGVVATLLTLRFIKLGRLPALMVALMFAGGLISGAAGAWASSRGTSPKAGH